MSLEAIENGRFIGTRFFQVWVSERVVGVLSKHDLTWARGGDRGGPPFVWGASGRG